MQLLVNDFFDETTLAIHVTDSLKKAFSYASRNNNQLTKKYDALLEYKLISSRLIPNEPYVEILFTNSLEYFKLEYVIPFISQDYLNRQLPFLCELAENSNYELKHYAVCK